MLAGRLLKSWCDRTNTSQSVDREPLCSAEGTALYYAKWSCGYIMGRLVKARPGRRLRRLLWRGGGWRKSSAELATTKRISPCLPWAGGSLRGGKWITETRRCADGV